MFYERYCTIKTFWIEFYLKFKNSYNIIIISYEGRQTIKTFYLKNDY